MHRVLLHWHILVDARFLLVVQSCDNPIIVSSDYEYMRDWGGGAFEFELPDRSNGGCRGMWTRLIGERKNRLEHQTSALAAKRQ